MPVNVLCIGDLVGRAGRAVLAEHLPSLITQRAIECVICNAENAAGGSGLTPAIFHKLIKLGVDCITMGDHVYRKKDILPVLNESSRIVRPANLSAQAVGRSWTVVPTKSGMNSVAVACVLGQMYMHSADSPWTAVDRVLSEMPADVKIRVIDFHADASSEKIAMGWHLDGRASVVFGTHTHTPTADARVLPGGTAHISDVGMTGPYEGVLGRRKDRVLASLTTSMPTHYEVATGDTRLMGLLVTVDPFSGTAKSVETIRMDGQPLRGGPYDSDDGFPQRKDHS